MISRDVRLVAIAFTGGIFASLLANVHDAGLLLQLLAAPLGGLVTWLVDLASGGRLAGRWDV